MHVAIPILITVVVLIVFIRLMVIYKEKIDFFSKGSEYKFLPNEISALWKLAKDCDLENPFALYVSVPALNACIMRIIEDARTDGTMNDAGLQKFLSKLYDFRTRVTLEEEKHKGIEHTRYFSEGQRVRVILPGKGVFAAKILNTGRELVLSLPRQYNDKTHRMNLIPADEWKGKNISVYLWRKGDASYAFDTTVLAASMFRGESAIFLRHTDKIDRAQKRQSIRAQCEIYAGMYMITAEPIDYEHVEEGPGFRCLLEDISEDGAMIRVGGKGRVNVQIKLQFSVNDCLVMMFGVVRAVEYNEKLDQSRLHFECTHIAPSMKNIVLGYVYNVVPQEEKDRHEAITQSENDVKEEEAMDAALAPQVPNSLQEALTAMGVTAPVPLAGTSVQDNEPNEVVSLQEPENDSQIRLSIPESAETSESTVSTVSISSADSTDTEQKNESALELSAVPIEGNS